MALGREREREFMDNYWTMEFHGDNQSIIYNPRFADDLERFFSNGGPALLRGSIWIYR
jgi:hypothetical protein